MYDIVLMPREFLSTLSLRRATTHDFATLHNILISIHALLAESDDTSKDIIKTTTNFYPRSPCGERPYNLDTWLLSIRFLSTLSLRRATCITIITICIASFLSTLSLRRATTYFDTSSMDDLISIHALLAESDKDTLTDDVSTGGFLSTLSLRRATRIHRQFPHQSPISIHALLAESDPGKTNVVEPGLAFLSTLSLRRATVHYDNYNLHCVISIHALLAESDFL